MKTSRDQLFLDNKPGFVIWFLAVFILVWVYIGLQIILDGDNMGYIFLAGLIAPLAFLSLVSRDTLMFDRPTQRLIITNRTFYRKRQTVEELGAVTKAKVQWTGRGTDRMARLVIELDTGPIHFGPPQRKHRTMPLVKKVNAWLDSKPPKA
ncbi:MAG: hypothetical protein ABJN34_09345 [Litoreibacter sp.]|uniref:hypothetical protein n=1 Tax=Litoreibacter sp. TaxID=1969459 RepID=UPI0032998E26